MPNLIPGFQSPDELSPETIYVRSIKEKLARKGRYQIDGGPFQFRLDKGTRDRFQEALRVHDMSMGEVLRMLVEEVLPLFEKAKPVSVEGYVASAGGYRPKKPTSLPKSGR